MKYFILLSGLVLPLLVSCEKEGGSAEDAQDRVERELNRRRSLDQTVWASENKAQEYEEVFVRLWDEIRAAEDKFAPLEKLSFSALSFGNARPPVTLDLGILRFDFTDDQAVRYDREAFTRAVEKLRSKGARIVESEWHHSEFTPASGSSPAKSRIATSIHFVVGAPNGIKDRFILRCDLHVTWAPGPSPSLDTIEARKLRLLRRERSEPQFVPRITLARGAHPVPAAQPLILNDLDGDGLSEIVIPSWNRIYRNMGHGNWSWEKLSEALTPLLKAAVVADLNGDQLPDLLAVSSMNRKPLLFAGTEGGRFANARVCGSVEFESPSVITAGDIDGDGDLDLWVAQYKPAYHSGQMPTPYYDANDGYPSALLLNDGRGEFVEGTDQAGLSQRRLRRTYSASFVDLDDDLDLDLLVVSDFSGVDVYENDGKGHFTDRNDAWIGLRHTFGMGHVVDDLNKDGYQDIYAIGMSSTTARRLDRLKLSRDDRPDIAEMRAAMAYGNRIYLGSPRPPFRSASFAAELARTGWSWGVTSLDYDNDGDRDLYVGNGHWSGKSCKDYCTRYWTQDIYTGSSKNDPIIRSVFADSMRDLITGQMSWNGYEKNVLFQNLGGNNFCNVAFLLGVSFSYDTRSVVSDDFDVDGRPDLIVARADYSSGQEFETTFLGYRNTVVTNNNWIGINLRDHGPGLSPIGARVAVHSAGGIQRRQIVTGDSFRSQHANTLHFGLGGENAVQKITIQWPNGRVSEISQPQVHRYHQAPAP